jgi:hypothetical protein
MGRYYHKMLSHYILWLPTLVPEEPEIKKNYLIYKKERMTYAN